MPLILLAAAVAALPELTPDQLQQQVLAADAVLFPLVFDRCDPPALRRLVTDDLEFYHDKGGFTANTGDAFVAEEARTCAGWTRPDAWRSRRELVAGTAHVYPVPGFGAIEEGDHRFYERQGSGPEKLAGIAHFVMLWRRDAEGWKLSRVLSYGHRAAE